MRVFIDLQGIQTRGSRNRGIGRYSRDLVNALIREAVPELELYLGWNHQLENPIGELDVARDNFLPPSLISAPYGALRRGRFAFDLHDANQDVNHRLFTNALARTGSGHVLFTSLMEADEPNFFLPKHLNFNPIAASYSIVYDIIPLIFKDEYLKSEALLTRYFAHLSVKLAADVIFTISDATRDDLVHHLNLDPARIVTIGTGIDPTKFRLAAARTLAVPPTLGLHKPFLLFMGGSEFRKNIRGFVAAVATLSLARQGALQALILGKVEATILSDIRSMAAEEGLPHDALIFHEYLSHDDLLEVYRACALTVVPSLYEGFGLPVLEAMACGAPVIASANSSMAEVIRDEAFLFDARDPAAIAACIDFALSNPAAVEQFKRGYATVLSDHTWHSVARRTLSAIEDIEARRTVTRDTIFGKHNPPKALAVAFLDLPEAAWIDIVTVLAGRHDVRVYYRTPAPEIETLPVPTGRLNAIWQHLDQPSPVFCFARNRDQFVEFARRYPTFNVVAILDESAVTVTRISSVDADMGEGFFATWRIDAGGVTVLWDKAAGPNWRPSAWHFESLPVCILDILDRYEAASAYRLAKDLKALISREPHLSRFAREIASQASIAAFDWRDLSANGEP